MDGAHGDEGVPTICCSAPRNDKGDAYSLKHALRLKSCPHRLAKKRGRKGKKDLLCSNKGAVLSEIRKCLRGRTALGSAPKGPSPCVCSPGSWLTPPADCAFRDVVQQIARSSHQNDDSRLAEMEVPADVHAAIVHLLRKAAKETCFHGLVVLVIPSCPHSTASKFLLRSVGSVVAEQEAFGKEYTKWTSPLFSSLLDVNSPPQWQDHIYLQAQLLLYSYRLYLCLKHHVVNPEERLDVHERLLDLLWRLDTFVVMKHDITPASVQQLRTRYKAHWEELLAAVDIASMSNTINAAFLSLLAGFGGVPVPSSAITAQGSPAQPAGFSFSNNLGQNTVLSLGSMLPTASSVSSQPTKPFASTGFSFSSNLGQTSASSFSVMQPTPSTSNATTGRNPANACPSFWSNPGQANANSLSGAILPPTLCAVSPPSNAGFSFSSNPSGLTISGSSANALMLPTYSSAGVSATQNTTPSGFSFSSTVGQTSSASNLLGTMLPTLSTANIVQQSSSGFVNNTNFSFIGSNHGQFSTNALIAMLSSFAATLVPNVPSFSFSSRIRPGPSSSSPGQFGGLHSLLPPAAPRPQPENPRWIVSTYARGRLILTEDYMYPLEDIEVLDRYIPIDRRADFSLCQCSDLNVAVIIWEGGRDELAPTGFPKEWTDAFAEAERQEEEEVRPPLVYPTLARELKAESSCSNALGLVLDLATSIWDEEAVGVNDTDGVSETPVSSETEDACNPKDVEAPSWEMGWFMKRRSIFCKDWQLMTGKYNQMTFGLGASRQLESVYKSHPKARVMLRSFGLARHIVSFEEMTMQDPKGNIIWDLKQQPVAVRKVKPEWGWLPLVKDSAQAIISPVTEVPAALLERIPTSMASEEVGEDGEHDLDVVVVQIYEVLNVHRRLCFEQRREELERIYAPFRKYMVGPKLETLLLFHGTSPSAISGICQNGFDWRRAGESVGALYGQGTYFTDKFELSSAFAPLAYPSSASAAIQDGTRHFVFAADVLVGLKTTGEMGMRYPPVWSDGITFDTAVDGFKDTEIYVKFEATESCPKYIIEFKVVDKEQGRTPQ